LYDKKWRVFVRRAKLFRQAPFVDFVFGAGSMALGNVTEESDFDVLVGTRTGRIFTARFFCVLLFGLFGWRRKKLMHHEAASDKICFNHFVTLSSSKLSPPYNDYWNALYERLVPIYGRRDLLDEFLAKNLEWNNRVQKFGDDLRHVGSESSFLKKTFEVLFSGFFGDFAEKVLKRLQVLRIESSLLHDPPGFKPRIKYSDTELEFHPIGERSLPADFLYS